MTKKPKSTYFITGFPGFIGRRLVSNLAHRHKDATIYLLVQPKFTEEAKRRVRELPRTSRFEVLTGDVVDMHLGLSGAEYARLCDEVTAIFHLAAVQHLRTPKELVRRVNVEGTRNVLELARDCRGLKRFSHFSSAFVSGDRLGVFAEDELDVGQSFRNVYEESKFNAEKLVRLAMKELPATIFRPSIVVGDSKTGEIDRFEGPYYLGILLVTSPLSVPLPLPGDGVAPLHVVPVDFVVQAALELAENDAAAGLTFHLVDPAPMSSRRVYEMVAALVHKKLPRRGVPSLAAGALLRVPFIHRLARPQQSAVDHINHLVFYNCQNTLGMLEGSGIRCPPIASYLPKLVEFVQEVYRKRRDEAVAEDPLDQPERQLAARE